MSNEIKNYDRSWTKAIRIQSENGYSVRSIQFNAKSTPPEVILTFYGKDGSNMSGLSWTTNTGYRPLRRNSKNTPLQTVQRHRSKA